MNGLVGWIAAVADAPRAGKPTVRAPRAENAARRGNMREKFACASEVWRNLPTHNFAAPQPAAASAPGPSPRLSAYRGRTAALLRRYMKFALDVGRVPSLLGRDFFRSRVTSYSVSTFEDRVIFVHDVERCLEKLDEPARKVLARVILQEYNRDEAARILRWGQRTVYRRLVDALDALSEILLEARLLDPTPQNALDSSRPSRQDESLSHDWEQEE